MCAWQAVPSTGQHTRACKRARPIACTARFTSCESQPTLSKKVSVLQTTLRVQTSRLVPMARPDIFKQSWRCFEIYEGSSKLLRLLPTGLAERICRGQLLQITQGGAGYRCQSSYPSRPTSSSQLSGVPPPGEDRSACGWEVRAGGALSHGPCGPSAHNRDLQSGRSDRGERGWVRDDG